MESLAALELVAAVVGLVFCVLVTVFRRFGPKSWMLAYFLFPSSLASGILGIDAVWTAELSPAYKLVASFSCLVFAATGGALFVFKYQRQDHQKTKRKNRLCTLALAFLPMVFVIPMLVRPLSPTISSQGSAESIALGVTGYASALLILVVSVVVLAFIEQILRSVADPLRWEIKFLLMGIGLSYGSMIYISSKILLYPSAIALLSKNSLSLYSVTFLISSCLTMISWRRSKGRTTVVVSHSVVYSSITLLSVGVYLILASLAAGWASGLGYLGIPAEAFFFLVSALFLAILLLGTGFRHRIRNWIRRHLLAGRYDYRQFWLEASERVQSTTGSEIAAAALAEIVHSALGAIDITVWIRLSNPNRMKLMSTRGSTAYSLGSEAPEIADEIIQLAGPTSKQELKKFPGMGATIRFMENARASLLVPLISSNRFVGAITIGSDRSGQPYEWEAREFLRVLGGHAAGEFHKSELLATLVAAKEKEAFSTFSTFILHDLKNFASTLSLIAQNAAKFQNNPEFQKDSFQSVYETAEKMKRLCSGLRSFSTTLAANKKPEDLNSIIRSTVDNLNVGSSGQLELELAELPKIMIDQEEIGRVLHNLVLNAQQAIASDGSIWVRTRARDGVVELTVTDNGKGISRHFLENDLFLPFHTTKSDGLGIGLFQTRKIVEAHDGKIQVDSEEGRGTTVTVVLIVCPEERIK
jgi:putative PEP-CTERM system histidine kinase